MSFGSIAEDYNELRPQPPQNAVDWLVPPGCEVAVDVGAGTGLFTRTLMDKAAQVIAVEPDARMREVLTARSRGSALSRAKANRFRCRTLPPTRCSSPRPGTGWILNGPFRRSVACCATAVGSA